MRVEDTGEAPHFELITPEDAEGPDVLILGMPNEGMMAGQPTNIFLVGYAGDESRKLTLVDTGTKESFATFEQAMEVTGIPVARIGQIVLTHGHPDHGGNAAKIKEITGAPVYAHPLEEW